MEKGYNRSMTRLAQTMSADALIAVALFMVAIIFFFALSNDDSGSSSIINLESESSKLVSAVAGTRNATTTFVSGSTVDQTKLQKLVDELDYPQLKDELGVTADFCIHFEDEDGNLIEIQEGAPALGSGYASVGGRPCRGLKSDQVNICHAQSASCGGFDESEVTQELCCTFLDVCCAGP